ncbi:aminoglycoside phosphotransferase family protein [Phycicoccus avicenniae]|uniref:aminoglycoside phosphotransferase family protein n=1 Tax=Phycicoccus avicenniae TaxID=2828860 RepID=UPI003D2ABACC
MADDITTQLVTRLVREQFPQWGDLAVEPVPRQGWDNRTFRLGDEMTVRLPSAPGYVPGVRREEASLALLDGRLPVRLPRVLARGEPSPAFDRPWSVRRWIPGTTLGDATVPDRIRVARRLGETLGAMHAAPTDGGPWAGAASFHRGCHPSAYADEVQEYLEEPGCPIDPGLGREIWHDAMTSAWTRPGVWVHGDLAPGNVLVDDEGDLTALIDLGQSGIGDPACDLVIAWTWCDADARRALPDAVGLDVATWRRARGWALWKALATLTGEPGALAPEQRRSLTALLADPVV